MRDGFGDSEIDNFYERLAFAHSDHNVAGFEVTMDHGALVCVVHALAGLSEQFKACFGIKLMFVTVRRNRLTGDVFHHEIRATLVGNAPVEYTRYVWMIHQRQRLTLRVEAGENGF